MCFVKKKKKKKKWGGGNLKDYLLIVLRHYLQNLVGMMHEAVESLRLRGTAFFPAGFRSMVIFSYQDGVMVGHLGGSVC